MPAPSNKVIGILAGMGPRSTAPFIDEVVSECQVQYGAKLDDDFPEMVILSWPTPFRVDAPIDHIRMQQIVLRGLQKLEAAKVSFIAMPCNSAHIYFEELKAGISVPLLNIIDETLAHVKSGDRVTVFATKPTFDAAVYQQGLKKFGSEFIFQTDWQALINNTITAIKGGDLDTAHTNWNLLLAKVKEQQVSTIISACTDLNVVARPGDMPVQFIDSGKSLAKAVVREYLRK